MVEFFAWVILALILIPVALIVIAVPVAILTALAGIAAGGIATLLDRK